MERGQTVKITDSVLWVEEGWTHISTSLPSVHAPPTSSPGPVLSSQWGSLTRCLEAWLVPTVSLLLIF